MTKPPQLDFAFEARVRIKAPVDLGITHAGHRRIIPILGGPVEGPKIRGSVLEGGADWQILNADGSADLEARYTIGTDDGALIYVVNRGMRRGNADVLKRLNTGESLSAADVDQIYFRTVATFETSAPSYGWLANAIFIGAGERQPNEVIVRFYRVG